MSCRRFGWIAAVVVAGVLLPVGVASAATPWTVSPSPNVGSDWLTGVSADSTTDGWAIGAVYEPNTYAPLVEHWNGTKWKPVTTAAGGGDSLYTVNAESSSNVWIGGLGDVDPILLHYDGANWTRTELSQPTARTRSPGRSRRGQPPTSGLPVHTSTSTTERLFLDHWTGSRWHHTLVVSEPRTCFTGVTDLAGTLHPRRLVRYCHRLRRDPDRRRIPVERDEPRAPVPPTGAPGSTYAFTGIGASSPTSPVFVVGS